MAHERTAGGVVGTSKNKTTAKPSTTVSVPSTSNSSSSSTYRVKMLSTTGLTSVRKEVQDAYNSLTDKEKALVNIDMKLNPEKYSSPGSSTSASSDPLYRATQDAKGLDVYLPDDVSISKLVPKNKYVFDAIDKNAEDGINHVWEEAYNSMGILRNFLIINSSGTPSEDGGTGADSISNLAYRKYWSRINEIEEEQKQQEKEAEWEKRVYQKDGIVDEGRTRAFRELSAADKEIIDKFGSDAEPSALTTSNELAVFNRFAEAANRYNRQAAAEELRKTLGEPVYNAGSSFLGIQTSAPSVTASSLRLSEDDAKALERKYNLPSGTAQTLVQEINEQAAIDADAGLQDYIETQQQESSEAASSGNWFSGPTGGMTGGASGIYKLVQQRKPREYTITEQQRNEQLAIRKRPAPVRQNAVALAEKIAINNPDKYSNPDEVLEAVAENKLVGSNASMEKGMNLAENFFYGAENTFAAMLGTVEDTLNYVSATFWLLGETVASVGGWAANPVSDWFKANKETVLGAETNSDKWFKDINSRYAPSEAEAKAAEFVVATSRMVPTLTAAALTGGQSLAPALTRGTGVVSAATPQAVGKLALFASASGAGSRQAYQESGDAAAAMAYGALSGSVELVTESLVGGIPFLGGGTADQLTKRAVSNLSTKPAVQAAVLKLTSMLGEGAEEIIAEAVDPIFQRITFKPDADFASAEELVEAGISGALMSLFIDVSFNGLASFDARREARIDRAIDAVNKAIAETEYGDYSKSALWDEQKIFRLSAYVGEHQKGSADIVISPEYYDALVNSRTELTKAEGAYQAATSNFTQALRSDRDLGVNEIRAYESEVKNAGNKLTQTRQAMTAAQTKWVNETKAVQSRAYAEEQRAAQEAEAQRIAQEQERAQQEEQAQREAEALMPDDLRVTVRAIESGNFRVNSKMVRIIQQSGVAAEQAQQLASAYSELQAQRNVWNSQHRLMDDDARAAQRARISQAEDRVRSAASVFAEAARTDVQQQYAWQKGFDEADRDLAYSVLFSDAGVNYDEAERKLDAGDVPFYDEGYLRELDSQYGPAIQRPMAADTQQLEQAASALSAEPQAAGTNPSVQQRAMGVFAAVEDRQSQAEWSKAPAQEEIPNTFVGEDGIRRSTLTGSYLVYEMGKPDNTRKGRQLVSRGEVARELSDVFATPISYGNDADLSGNSAAGLYYEKSGLTKIKYPNDIQTVIHEIGHRIDSILELGDVSGAEAVWQTFPDNVKSYYGNSADALQAEAKAEVFRMYVNNPEAARSLWPEFVTEIENKMTRSQRRAVQRASRVLRAEAAADITAKIKNTITDRTAGENVVRKVAKAAYSPRRGLEAVQQWLLDTEAAFSRFDRDAARQRAKNGEGGLARSDQLYIAAKDLLSSRSRAMYMLEGGGIVERQDNGDYKRIAKSFSSCFDGLKTEADIKDLDLYLNMTEGLHREAENKTVWPQDLDRGQIRQAVEDFKKNRPEIVKAAENVHAWWNTFMEHVVVPSGLVPKSMWENWKAENPEYIPLTRSGLDAAFSGMGSVSAASVFTKQMQGSTYDTYSATQELAIKVIQTVAKVERTAFDRRFYDMITSTPDMAGYAVEVDTKGTLAHTAQAKGDQDTWWSKGPAMGMGIENGILAVRMQDGSIKYLKINDEGLRTYYIHTLKMSDNAAQRDACASRIFEFLHEANRVRASMLTALKPTFAISNTARDFVEGATTTSEKNPAKYLFDQIGGILTAGGKKVTDGGKKNVDDILDTFELFEAVGGSTGLYGALKETRTIKTLMGSVQPQRKSGLRKVAAGAENVLSFLGEASERGQRYAEFKRVYEQTGDAKLAFYEANRFTVDFRGSGTGLDKVKQVMMFAGANLNGFNKDIRAVTGQEFIKEDGSIDTRKRNEYIAKKIAYITLPVLLCELAREAMSDDEAELVAEYEEDGYYMIPIGGGNFLKFALPNGVSNTVFREIGQIAGRAITGEDLELLQSLADVASSMSPFGDIDGANPFGNAFILAPVLQTLSNKRWNGGEIDSKYDEENSPELRYNDNTTALARKLGTVTHTSPKRWDYLLDQMCGFGYDVYNFLDDGDGISLKNLPAGIWDDLKSRVISNVYYDTDAFSNFYDAQKKIETVTNDIKDTGGSSKYRNGLSASEIEEANAEADMLFAQLTDMSYGMSEIRKEIKLMEEEGASENELLEKQKELAGIALEGLLQYEQFAERYMR